MNLTEDQADQYDAALDHVNDIRNELGLTPATKLLPGKIADAFHCPISNTILSGVEDAYCSSSFHYTTIYDGLEDDLLDDEGAIVRDIPLVIDTAEMSDLAFLFQKSFDRRDFPELIAE